MSDTHTNTNTNTHTLLPPSPAWSSAIFSSAADYSAQCVDRPRLGATCAAYLGVCSALKLSREKHNKNKILIEGKSDGGMTTTSICGCPSQRRPQGCCCCSSARGTDASAGHRCCYSPPSCSAPSPSAPAFQVD